MASHSLFYFPYASFTTAQLQLLKVAGLYFDKLVILDPVGASWQTIGVDEHARDAVRLLEQEHLLEVWFQDECVCSCAPMRPGSYATEINIYTFHPAEVPIRKVVVPVVLAGAAIGRKPRGESRRPDKIVLPPRTATMDDCCRIAPVATALAHVQNAPVAPGLRSEFEVPAARCSGYAVPGEGSRCPACLGCGRKRAPRGDGPVGCMDVRHCSRVVGAAPAANSHADNSRWSGSGGRHAHNYTSPTVAAGGHDANLGERRLRTTTAGGNSQPLRIRLFGLCLSATATSGQAL